MFRASDIRLCGGVFVAPQALLLAATFLLLALPIGAMLAVQWPLGHVADETGHIMRAAGLLHGETIGHREVSRPADGEPVVRAMVLTEPALQAVMTVPFALTLFDPMATTRPMVVAAQAVAWGEPAAVDLKSLAGYFPVFYMPGAIVIGIVRLLGGSPYEAFFAVRLVNLLLFALQGGAALLLTRRGAGLMFCALVLPMSLNLAASASQDGLLLSAIALALAMLSRAADGAAPVARSGWYRAALAPIACVAAAKPPYLPVAALLLLPLEGLAAEWRGRLAATVVACLPALLWIAWAHDISGVPHSLPPYEAGPLWPGTRPAMFHATDPAAQLRVLLERPGRVAGIAAATLWRDRLLLPEEMIGQLGWLNVLLPGWLYMAWLAALMAAALADFGGFGASAPRWRETPLVLAVACLCLALVMIAQYLTWSPVGYASVEGVQGRYLLPLLALLGQAVPVVRGGRRLRWLLLAPVAVAAIDVAVLPRVVIDWYYLP
jgi:hypothetical protein